MIKVRDLFGCDPKKSAQTFVADNVEMIPVEHYFENLAAVTNTGQASHGALHGQECKVPQSPRLDALITGFPCAPYSQQRPGRHGDQRWLLITKGMQEKNPETKENAQGWGSTSGSGAKIVSVYFFLSSKKSEENQTW